MMRVVFEKSTNVQTTLHPIRYVKGTAYLNIDFSIGIKEGRRGGREERGGGVKTKNSLKRICTYMTDTMPCCHNLVLLLHIMPLNLQGY